MQQWQVGPVPEYIYSNSTHQPSDIHGQHPYQQQQQQQPDMHNRDQRQFQYGGPQASPAQQHAQHQQHQQHQQQHHQTPVPPPMTTPQQQQQQQPAAQQLTPQQAPAPTPAPSRQRKRAAPSAAASAAPAAPAAAAPGAAASTTAPAAGAPADQKPAQASAPGAAGAQPASADNATGGSAPPPAKKTRTNTPWTPAEEQRLKQMRDAGNSWAEIAKTFPTRTEGSVKKHWYKDMHYAEFAEDESQALLNAIKEYENNKWKVIGQKVGKPAKACEQYAKENFPDLWSKGSSRNSDL